MSKPMPILGLCQWRTIPTRKPAPTIARRLPVPDKADYGPNNASVDDGYPSNLSTLVLEGGLPQSNMPGMNVYVLSVP